MIFVGNMGTIFLKLSKASNKSLKMKRMNKQGLDI
jgi:hypothetical protein